VIAGAGALACASALAAVPFARGSDAVIQIGVRLVPVALLMLAAALVLGWSPLVPVSIVLAGSFYAVQLAVDDAPLDAATPVLAAGFLLTAELAYWSLEEREGVRVERGEVLRRVAFVALLALAALVVAAVLLALVDAVQVRGLAVDVVGAVAAAAVLLAVLVAARGHSPRGH
jgi:hypothetical protein